MRRLLKYTKPYLLLILLALGLLYAMVNADLALPDYLSRIVNVGIQQNGIQDAVPQAMRQQTVEKLNLFLSPEEQQLLLSHYTLVDSTSPDFDLLQKTYPLLTEEPLYILNKIEKTDRQALNAILTRPIITLSVLTMLQSNPDQVSQMIGSLPEGFAQLPVGVDPFMMLSKVPPEQLEMMKQEIDQKFDDVEPMLLSQFAVVSVKAEHDAIQIDPAKFQTNYILQTGLMMLLLSLAAGAASITVSLIAARVSASIARDLRRDVFHKVESFSSQEFNSFSTASLITRSTNDIAQVQMLVFMTIRLAFMAPLMGIGGVVRALGKSPNMWWIIALAVLITLGLVMLIFSIAMPKFKIIQKLVDRLNLVTRENLSGMMVIRAFNKQSFEEKRFDSANKDLAATGLFINRVMVAVQPLMIIVLNVLQLVIIWVGAQQIAASTLRVGDMMAFMQYAMQIMFAFINLSMLFIFLPRAAVSGVRIADVLEKELAIRDPQQPVSFPEPFHGRIEFDDVSFRYPDAEDFVLHDITFTAQPGEVTAFIGSTGCGKSTVVNLIPRFYDVSEGSVKLDGVDVREVNQHELRDKIGYIPQQGNLFSGTVESNLRFADEDASEDVLRESLDIAQASEFVFEKPEGLEAEISQGGTNVSGGQKQRLSIARALVKRAPVYIFDDSFSALDFKTDAALRRALKEKTGDSTVLIVTQRVATVKGADQIIVLENGRIVGKGKHKELMQTCQAYQEIAKSQLSAEELA